jgi:hypothetical protein
LAEEQLQLRTYLYVHNYITLAAVFIFDPGEASHTGPSEAPYSRARNHPTFSIRESGSSVKANRLPIPSMTNHAPVCE